MTRSEAAIPWRLIFPLGAIPALVAVAQLGRIHPDEVYQTLEPAFFRAFGYGVLSWEWSEGIRNWAIPLAFSGLLKLCGAIGLSDPRKYRAVLEVPQYLLHCWMLAAVFRYAHRRVGSGPAVWATVAVGLYAPVIVFAGRTLGESFSAAFFVIGIEAMDRPEVRFRSSFLAGAALGLSVVARYGSAVLVIGALSWALFRRRWRELAFTALGGMAAAAALGGLDWMTWGTPFHSCRAYFDFNVASGRAAQQFGASPVSYYVPVFARALPAWAWLGLPFAIWRERRISLPLFCACAYAVAITAVAHKEERFAYPALVLIAVAAAPGLMQALQAVSAGAARHALASLSVASSVLGFIFPGELRAQRGDQFRAIVRATRATDAAGLLIVNEGLWGAGGSFYVGKRIPWLTCDWPNDQNFQIATHDRRFNRCVSYDRRAVAELQAAGFQMIDQVGRASILARP